MPHSPARRALPARRAARAARAALVVALAAAFAPQVRAQIAVGSNSTQEREARPGESYRGTIVVQNTSDVPQQARLYASDYRFYADGRSMYERPGTVGRSNAAWIALSQSELTVPPRQSVTVAYTVTVPADGPAPLAGSYWSMVMVEGLAADAPEARHGAARVQVGVRPVLRYGVQLVTHIGGSGARHVGFAGLTIATSDSGTRVLQFDVLNDGERARRLTLSLELFTEAGVPAGTFHSTRGLVYPGCSIRQHFDLGALPPGTYRALLVADAGEDELFAGRYTLRF